MFFLGLCLFLFNSVTMGLSKIGMSAPISARLVHKFVESVKYLLNRSIVVPRASWDII